VNARRTPFRPGSERQCNPQATSTDMGKKRHQRGGYLAKSWTKRRLLADGIRLGAKCRIKNRIILRKSGSPAERLALKAGGRGIHAPRESLFPKSKDGLARGPPRVLKRTGRVKPGGASSRRRLPTQGSAGNPNKWWGRDGAESSGDGGAKIVGNMNGSQWCKTSRRGVTQWDLSRVRKDRIPEGSRIKGERKFSLDEKKRERPCLS